MPPRRHHGFETDLGLHVRLRVRWETERDVVRYAVMLLVRVQGIWHPVELFDCSHDDRNDRHRYNDVGVKGVAEPFHDGMPGEAMRAAIDLIRTDYARMIERWQP